MLYNKLSCKINNINIKILKVNYLAWLYKNNKLEFVIIQN